MRILRLARVHYRLLRAMPQSGDWRSQERRILASGTYGGNDALSHALGSLGHVATDIVANDLAALRMWAEENEHPTEGENWVLDALAERIRRFAPDVLFISDFKIVPPEWVQHVRQQVGIPAVVVWCGAVWQQQSYFSTADLVLTCVPELIDDFAAHGTPVRLLPHAFDARLLDELPERTPSERVMFAGNLQRWQGRHLARVELLEELVQAAVPIDIHAPENRWNYSAAKHSAIRSAMWYANRALELTGVPAEHRRRSQRLADADKWETPPPAWRSRVLRGQVQPPLFGLAMLRRLRQTAVGLNVHADVSVDYASNLRLFEATGVGTCLLTEQRKNLGEFFDIGRECVVYESPTHCIEQARWLLDNPAAREEIAAAGRDRTLHSHTMTRRAEGFLDAVSPLVPAG